jgi:hypothetical protein
MALSSLAGFSLAINVKEANAAMASIPGGDQRQGIRAGKLAQTTPRRHGSGLSGYRDKRRIHGALSAVENARDPPFHGNQSLSGLRTRVQKVGQ